MGCSAASGTTSRGHGTTARAVLSCPVRYYHCIGELYNQRGTGSSSPYPHSVSSSSPLQQRRPPRHPPPVCRLRAVLLRSPPVGSIPTLPECHGCRYCPVPFSLWFILLNFVIR